MAYGKIKADAFIYDDGGDQEITMATIASNSNKAPTASPTFTGTVTLPATTALAGQASDVTIIDNNAAALEVKQGTTAYVTFDTTDSSEQIEVAKKVQLAEDLEFSAAKDILIPDNQAAGLEIKEGTNAYVTFDTTDGSEQIEVAKEVVSTQNITLNAGREVRFSDSDSSNYIAVSAPGTVATNSTWILPSDAPVAGDALKVTSVSSNNPTLEWGAISSKIVSCAVFQNNTRFVPSDSSNSARFVEWFSPSFNKTQAGTELWIWGSTQCYGAYSGGGSLEVTYNGTTDQAAGAIHYPNTYTGIATWAARITGHTTTGSQSFSIGHRNEDDSRPYNIIHPISSDHGGLPTSAQGGTGTTLYILEVDV